MIGPLGEYPVLRNMKAFLGHLLNFHRYFNENLGPAWLENERRRMAEESLIPPFRLFDFDPAIPIREFLDDVGLPSTRAGGRSLYARLACLPAHEHATEIEKVDTELRKLGRKQTGYSISLDTFDTLTSMATEISGVGNIIRFGKWTVERVRKKSTWMDKKMAQLTSAMHQDGTRSC